jgi:hypothetical protein
VAASVEELLVGVTHAPKRRGIILIEDYEERSKRDEEGADIVRDLLLRPDAPTPPYTYGLRTVVFP